MNAAVIAQVAARIAADRSVPTLLRRTALLDLGPKTDQGLIVQAVLGPWVEIAQLIQRNPELLFEFVKHHRKFEEFIAGAYAQDGWDVELTPPSGDLGRDVIATKDGNVAIRVVDQCKAFAPGHVVTADDVRAVGGVLLRDQNVSKGVITTTSTFAPGIAKEFADLTPYRLELRDGEALAEWLREIASEENK